MESHTKSKHRHHSEVKEALIGIMKSKDKDTSDKRFRDDNDIQVNLGICEGDIKVEEEECVSIDQYTDNIAAENYVLKEENEDEFECKIESEFLFSEQEQRVVPDSCSDDFSVETRCEDNQPRRKLLKRQHNDSPTQVNPETLVKKKWKYLRDQFVKPRASKGNFSSLLASDAAGTSLPGSPQQGYQMDDMEPPLVSEESMSASPPHTQDTPVHEDEVMDKHRLTSASSYLKKKGASKRLKTEDYNQSILDIERIKNQYLKEKSSRKQDKDDDEDLMFFKSLLPHVKRIPVEQKLTFRGRIQEIVQHFAYQVPITSPSPHTYGSSAPPSVSTPQVSPHSYTHFPLEPHSYTHSPLEPHSYTHSPLEPQNVATDSYNISLL